MIALAMLSFGAYAEEIEETIVVGAKIYNGYSDPMYDTNLLEGILYTKRDIAGGLGGFHGIQLNGTDTKHTAVYKNGVPVNDPSSGWYDFGNDLPAHQNIRTISGPNSAKYGSGSMAGVVLIEDNFERNLTLEGGEDLAKIVASYEWFNEQREVGIQLAHYNGSNGSAMTYNDELDWYENTTVKFGYANEHGKINFENVKYSYDYDQCWYMMPPSEWEDWMCDTKGEKTTVSLRNEWVTLGYTSNEAEHNTGYGMESERLYGNIVLYKDTQHELGVTLQEEKYDTRDRDTQAIYYNWQNDFFGIGYRYEEGQNIGRIGLQQGEFRFSIANSYRLPNLYEQFGDAWVSDNPDLQPESGIGVEFGYKDVSIYHYEFDEGIDFDYNRYQYVNSGEYSTHGIRYQDQILLDNGSLFVYTEYTETDKIRVPRYKTKLSYWTSGNFNGIQWDTALEYIGEFKKGKDFDARAIDDVNTINFKFGVYANPTVYVMISVDDLMNNKYEVLPDYASGGRTIRLSIDKVL